MFARTAQATVIVAAALLTGVIGFYVGSGACLDVTQYPAGPNASVGYCAAGVKIGRASCRERVCVPV